MKLSFKASLGGCEDCGPDRRIIGAATRIMIAGARIEQNGLPYPRGMDRRTVLNAFNESTAAAERIVERHPGSTPRLQQQLANRPRNL